jgi:hypothetical protein
MDWPYGVCVCDGAWSCYVDFDFGEEYLAVEGGGYGRCVMGRCDVCDVDLDCADEYPALPLRRWSYRVFYVNHYVSTALFLSIAVRHVPRYARAPIHLSAAILALNKLFTFCFFVWNNVSVKTPVRRSSMAGLKGVRGRGKLAMGFPVRMSAPCLLLSALPRQIAETTTIIRMSNIPFSWKPGQYVQLYIPALGRWEIHPFTPANCSAALAPPLPPRGNADTEAGSSRRHPQQTSEMLLLIKSKSGFTRRLADHHRDWLARPCPNATQPAQGELTAYIDGPYGNAPEWHEYETLVLVASSTGIAFALSVLDYLEQLCLADSSNFKTKSIKVVWTTRHIDPAFNELIRATLKCSIAMLLDFGITLTAEVFVTCPDSQPLSQPQTREFDPFTHLRPVVSRRLSDEKPLRIRSPDEIYEEWEREAEDEAEDEAARWADEDDYTCDEESEASDNETLLDNEEEERRKSNEEESWVASLDGYTDEEDDPLLNEQEAEVSVPSPTRRSSGIVSESTPGCNCALIQHQCQKLYAKAKVSQSLMETPGYRPDVPRMLENGVQGGRTMVAVCSNSNVVRDVRRKIADMNWECAKGGRSGRVKMYVEGEGLGTAVSPYAKHSTE